jgi:energy-coupling factor transporter ATP-binding protein EcfA2
MKMIKPDTICPYTGLRSFTEEESLYFKGRDQQIDKISALLEQNKFLMVTGASGEGKSSLIYAGLVPNARAGFFKAKFTNWIVADFRPERSPVRNMAHALAEKFNLTTASVETELRRGYSSLVDLYTNSGFYVDEQDESWTMLPESEKRDKHRKSANLLILADQFEEFFTNPENYYKEAPSQDSQIVVNLIIETARIALKRDLPIYIVCTMRSDYIGQCSAFRGLPEYIGYSQFFVPRLKRKDLKQVIEEPAILSGNRITQRLIERLVFDLAEGIDQLPILQHALSQIWLAASHGNEELDLIHYAMVGGMSVDELPDQDQVRFKTWLVSLPEYKKTYYAKTGLNKIIEIHANSLYESASEYYNAQSPDKLLSKQDAKKIIALTFASLTKIDHSRAVRNRMSLDEITAIINLPDISSQTVGKVLNIYRDEENAFIRPFKTDDPDTFNLSGDTVLDITHESLIRNWNKLIQWAGQEFEFYSTYLDFKKQLDRWQSSGKDKGYLLPIGPLTYFEDWYKKCKPNPGWIKRYEEVNADPASSDLSAKELLIHTQEFLKQSADQVRLTRAFMKYGPKRIAIFLAILCMVFLSGFYLFDAEQKQNNKVIQVIRNQSMELMQSDEVGLNIKAFHLIIDERYEHGTLLPFLESMEPKKRISMAIEVYKALLEIDKKGDSGLKQTLVKFIEKNYTTLSAIEEDPSLLINELNTFSTLLSYDNYYSPMPEKKEQLRKSTQLGFTFVVKHFREKSLFNPAIASELNYSLQMWLTFGQVSKDGLLNVLQLFSPFENEAAKTVFNGYYPKGSLETNGRIANDFNGGYHTLASLYAAAGNTDRVIDCFEFLKKSGQNDYFTGSLFNNYTHILGIFYQFDYKEKANKIVEWLSTNYETNTPLIIYRNAVIRAGYLSYLYKVNIEKNILRSYRGHFFPNLCLADRKVFNELSDDYEKLILQVTNKDERNYLISLNYKRRAMFEHKWSYDQDIRVDSLRLNHLMSDAIDHFKLIDSAYLEGKVPSIIPYYSDGVRNRQVTRRELLIYPDYMDGWFSWTYHSDLFFNYLLKENQLNEFYKTAKDLESIHFWIAKANEKKPIIGSGTFDNIYPLGDHVLKSILEFVDHHPQGTRFDRNLIYLLLANHAFAEKDTMMGMHYYSLVDLQNIVRSSNRYEYLEKTFFLNQMKDLAVNLAGAGKNSEAVGIAELFEKAHFKAFAYIFMADRIFSERADPYTFVYVDSIFSNLKNIDFSQFNGAAIDIRFRLLRLLTRIGSDKINQKANSLLKEIPEGDKPNALFEIMNGVADEGNFYRAYSSIPNRLTENEDLICRSFILYHAAKKKETPEEAATWKSLDYFANHDYYYVYYLPN